MILRSKGEGNKNVESGTQQRKARGKGMGRRWEKQTAAVSDKIKRKQMKLKSGSSKAPMGIEHTASCLQDKRSNQLRYGALHDIR